MSRKACLFTESELEAQAKCAVLGTTVVQKLYGANANPIGQTIRINNVPFQVIGVLQSKGQSMNGQDNDDVVFIPETTYQAKIQGGIQKYVNGTIMIGAVSDDQTTRAQTQVTALLRDRHHIEPGTEDDFNVRNLSDIAAP